jgi:FkbM family methyltransferase
MITNKKIPHNGKEIMIAWPETDQFCFDYLIEEWKAYSGNVLDTIEKYNGFGTLIQAGGNDGLYAIKYSDYFKSIFTFEPEPINFHCLSINCVSNKVIKFNVALGETNKFVNIGVPDFTNTGMAKIVGNVPHSFSTFMITIDSLQIPDVSAIHLDIEGNEYNALKGAVDTIKTHRPTVITEVSDNEKDIDLFFETLDYKMIAHYGKPVSKVYVAKEKLKK